MGTMLHRAAGYSATLLVLQDEHGAVFGALITEALKIEEKEKYYGNGTIGVWSFVTGSLQVSICVRCLLCTGIHHHHLTTIIIAEPRYSV